jgi:NADH dehydrogenase
VPEYPGVFALGDCVHQENPKKKQPYPPTAQVAMNQAAGLAKNITASISQARLSPFVFSVAGMFVPLGHRSAVAIVKGLKMRGFLAWWLSRGMYLFRLPTWSNKIRVAVDWGLDFFFPKDTTRITLR